MSMTWVVNGQLGNLHLNNVIKTYNVFNVAVFIWLRPHVALRRVGGGGLQL